MPQGSAGSWPLDDRVLRVFAGLTVFVLVMAALREAASVFAPATFALFVIAVVWPLQRTLQHALPKFAALVLTLVTALVAIVAVAFLMSWGFGRIGQWMVANAGRFQEVTYGKSHGWTITASPLLASLPIPSICAGLSGWRRASPAACEAFSASPRLRWFSRCWACSRSRPDNENLPASADRAGA